jgi:hypothetical protein
MAITTIKLQKETKDRLDKLRENRSESYDDIMRKILYVLNATREDPGKGKRVLEHIDEMRNRMLDREREEELEKKREKAAKKKKVVKKKTSKA